MNQRPRAVLRIEFAVCVGCAVVGGVFELGGSTLQAMAIFLFGWSLGCVIHLTQMFVTKRLQDRRRQS
jgi:NhaP-type Na+/H+ or K+/H+ antiporter